MKMKNIRTKADTLPNFFNADPPLVKYKVYKSETNQRVYALAGCSSMKGTRRQQTIEQLLRIEAEP